MADFFTVLLIGTAAISAVVTIGAAMCIVIVYLTDWADREPDDDD